MINERQLFLSAIRERPGDDGLRLIYADYLAERGESEFADFIRVQVELASGRPRRCKCGGEYAPLRRDRLPLMSMCNKCHQDGPFWKDLDGLRCTGSQNSRISPFCSDPACKLCELTAKESILFGQMSWRSGGGLDNGYPWHFSLYRRGLIESLPMTATEVLTRLDSVLERHPIRHVEVTGRLRFETDRDGRATLLAGDEKPPRRRKASAPKDILPPAAEATIESVLRLEWPGIDFDLQRSYRNALDAMNLAFMAGVGIPPHFLREQLGLPEPTE